MEMENNLKSILYMTVNTVNNKIYIGVHITEKPYEFDNYYGDGITGTSCYWFKHPKYPFQRACKKYGLKVFKRYTLMVFDSYEEALKQERFIVNEEFIKRADTYNVALGGGSGLVISTEKPVYQYDLEGNFIKEYRSISDASRKLDTSVANIIHALQCKGISCGHYWSFSKVMRLNIESCIKPQAKPVYLYDLSGNFIEEIESVSECARKLEVCGSTVRKAITHQTKCCSFYISFDKVQKLSTSPKKRKRGTLLYQYDLTGKFIKAVSIEEAKEICGECFKQLHNAVYEKYQCAGYFWRKEKLDYIEVTPKRKKQIEQYDLNGNLIKVWDSYRECVKEFSNLRYVLAGARSNTKGFYFKYKIEQN